MIGGVTNRVLLKVMLNIGLRRAELTALRWIDLDLMTGKVMVRKGKEAKDRTLWLGEETLEELQKWRERQVQLVEEPKYVFMAISKEVVGNPLDEP